MSVLATYRPNFCAECGTKIVRLRWFPWTSRRFCDSCVPKFRREHMLQILIQCIVLLCFGALIGRALKPESKPLIIQRPAVTTSPVDGVKKASGLEAAATPSTTDEQVYSCGARTKKGTPCSRRVHGPVRCWQHKGMPAMLPQDKLRIND